ncbi:hypothetical protein BDR03DRAFT_1008574 [Suillus americanus]|nr:hypothetical protein BDR03DRAFT_1008574 [Suillus americanus]
MPQLSKKTSQAKSQHCSGTRFVQQCSFVEADEEEQDSTYVYHSSGEEEVWTDLDSIEDEPETGSLAEDISALQTLYSAFLPHNMQSKGAPSQKGNKRKLSDHPAIYKGVSRMTQCQQPKTPNNGPLLVKSEQELLSDLEQDPALDFTLSTGFDMADLCATYLETWLDKQGHNMVLDKEDELELATSKAMTQHDPELHEDSEYPPESAEIESACEWLDVNDEENVEPHNTLLLLIKAITQLSAIAQYVKLQDRYLQHARTKCPCLSASLAIARRMGKGPYFARQICNNERYLSRYHSLPPRKDSAYRGHATLLDNKAVVQSVCQYLASQNLGTITPHNLCNHINKVIIPALGLTADTSSIRKNHNAWWDLKQLVENVKDAIDIFEHTNPGMVAFFIFDCSSAHKGLAPDALNINNMNVGPRGKQKYLCDTIIPLSNPPPKPGRLDTCGVPQTLIYPSSHPNEKLTGKPKGMRAVLEHQEIMSSLF